ncbi:MAG: methyltransferase domain-containing protein [Chitinophagaceae bacterium]
MGTKRKIGSGIYKVVRFNWHFYVIAVVVLGLLIFFLSNTSGWLNIGGWILVLMAMLSVLISLLVTFYVYDLSGLYDLSWLKHPALGSHASIINIHAGYDETTELIVSKFPNAEVEVFDFFDPKKHTEVSIQRARILYPSFPGTRNISTEHIPLANKTADLILLIFAAHEIRDDEERRRFFVECGRILKSQGHIVVVEHLRDLPNALAYNIGFFHFHSSHTWEETFKTAGLSVLEKRKINTFVNLYILGKYDPAFSNYR